MADVTVGAVPAPAAPAEATPAVARRPDPAIARAAKLATVSAGLAKLIPAESVAASVVETPAASEVAKPAATSIATDGGDKKPVAAPPDDKKPAAATTTDKTAATVDDPPDEKTAKAIAAIDRRAKQFRDEQAAERAKLELDRAELARLRTEIDGRGSSIDELRKLAKRDPISLLAKLGVESEDEWELVGRGAYPRTKPGKADPKAAPAAAQTERERALDAQLAELRQQQTELIDHLRTRDAAAQSQTFVAQYLDGAVKAIPEAPSLIGKLHAKSPAKARSALLDLGKVMEREAMAEEGATKYDPSHTPSHAELVARYEKDRRVELEEQGVDVDALLAPTSPAKPAPTTKPAATLDPTSTTGTRPLNGNPTREQKLAAVNAGLKKLDAAQN